MRHLECPDCGTIYDVTLYPSGHAFQCECGRALTVEPTAPETPPSETPAPESPFPGPAPIPPAVPALDPGLQPGVKALVFAANLLLCLCLTPLGAIVPLIVYFVIKDQRPRTAAQLCRMTWIPFLIGSILWVLYFAFIVFVTVMGTLQGM